MVKMQKQINKCGKKNAYVSHQFTSIAEVIVTG